MHRPPREQADDGVHAGPQPNILNTYIIYTVVKYKNYFIAINIKFY